MSELLPAPTTATIAGPAGSAPGRLRGLFDSDLLWSFRHSPVAIVAAIVALTIILSAAMAPLIAPHDPFDLASLSLLDASNPPGWISGGSWSYPLGTDNQGRDVLSAILYGARLSLVVGFSAVVLALLIGVTLGLVAGWRGGFTETVIMRIADVQLSFPAILLALLIDGVARSLLSRDWWISFFPGIVRAMLILSVNRLGDWLRDALNPKLRWHHESLRAPRSNLEPPATLPREIASSPNGLLAMTDALLQVDHLRI